MNIGILTLHHLINYGAVYQVYALKTRLESMGHNLVIINYRPPHITGRFTTQKMIKGPKTALIFTILHNTRQRREAFFNKFVSDNFILTREYLSPDELREDPPELDAVIVGSDQVWNPRIIKEDSSFFLDWVKPGTRKISYAASIASDKLTPEIEDMLKKSISSIDYLSVRETPAADMIEKVCGRKAETVLDPTLISEHEWWEELRKPYNLDEPYTLNYLLQKNELIFDTLRTYSKHSSEPVYNVFGELFRFDGIKENRYNITPGNFLDAVDRAECVITNSFHGTIFSLLYKTPVLSVQGSAENSRVMQLLKAISRENIFISENMSFDELQKIKNTEPINLFGELQSQRESSMDFLFNALK